MKDKALFLDRDGTINVDYAYVYKTEDFKFIDGIVELCQNAQKKGYKILVITNQSGVERGYYTIEDMNRFNDFMKSEFLKNNVEITDIYCCPYLNHPDRKPSPDMFIRAAKEHNIDVENSISTGDKKRDIDAAKAAGIKKNYLFTQENEADYNTVKKLTDIIQYL